jgi:hypothetical protein
VSAPSRTDTVAYLARAYPRQPFDLGQYERELADIPESTLAAAVKALLRTSREWAPSVGEIRAACAETALGLPTERDAARQVEARIQWARGPRQADAPVVHPLVREAVAHVGGWHSIRCADRPEVVRGQMLRFFREARDAEIRAVAALDMT